MGILLVRERLCCDFVIKANGSGIQILQVGPLVDKPFDLFRVPQNPLEMLDIEIAECLPAIDLFLDIQRLSHKLYRLVQIR